MYLNDITNLEEAYVYNLTVTWDVFKLDTGVEFPEVRRYLTVTWDVFKQQKLCYYYIDNKNLTVTWDVLR